MNRRAFLGRLAAAFGAALASPALLELLPAPASQGLTLDPAAFGISMRFIERWDVETVGAFNCYDVLYGFASFAPSFGCRVVNASPLRAGSGFATYLDADRAIQERL